MANATARVARASVSVVNENTTHSYGTLSSPLQLYAGAMVGLNAGYLAKFDDTASLKFFGIILEKDGNPKLPNNGAASGTAGDGTLDLDVKQPKLIELAVASIAITDIGRRVYAVDDQTGTLDPSATTYANLIGVVADLVYAASAASPVAGYCRVRPIYDAPNGDQIQVAANSGAVLIKASTVFITKSSAAALTIADPTTGVHDGMTMSFISTTAQTHSLSNAAGSGFNNGGAGTDVGTFGGAIGDNITIRAYGGKWLVDRKTNVTLG